MITAVISVIVNIGSRENDIVKIHSKINPIMYVEIKKLTNNF